jgi:hypothetical protein
MKTIIAILLMIVWLLIGIAFGLSWGYATCLSQVTDAAQVIMDVHLNNQIRTLVMGLPPLLARISVEDKEKLGLEGWKADKFNGLNQTIQSIMKVKYGVGQ